MKDISIIIVSYNVREYIIYCIDSIYKHCKGDYTFEIIVIDNQSTDKTVDVLKVKYPELQIISNKENYGFSKAANQASKVSRSKYLFILNPDTLLIEDSILKLKEFMESNSKIGMVGPLIINENGLRQQSIWKNPTLINTLLSICHLDFLNFKKKYKILKYDKMKIVDTISGCALFLRGEVFKKVNGFNDNLFWMEDIDLCQKLKKRNWNVAYFPKTKLIHYGGRSAKKNYKVAISNQLISKIKYFKIYHSNISAFIISVTVINVSLLKAFFLIFLFPFSVDFRNKFFGYVFTAKEVLIKHLFDYKRFV